MRLLEISAKKIDASMGTAAVKRKPLPIPVPGKRSQYPYHCTTHVVLFTQGCFVAFAQLRRLHKTGLEVASMLPNHARSTARKPCGLRPARRSANPSLGVEYGGCSKQGHFAQVEWAANLHQFSKPLFRGSLFIPASIPKKLLFVDLCPAMLFCRRPQKSGHASLNFSLFPF